MTEPTDPLEGLIEPTEPEDHSPLEKPGNKIGPYRLLQVLGSGGMGEVWLAERREPYVQRVALKVVKPGMDTKAVLSRFEQERQVLAQMSHPNIAKVLDAGVNEQGRPYFVMEYVPGKPITEFADEHKLSIQARLEYFMQVCNAIAHAHQKGVIHRDIKPGNILVSRGEIGEVGTGSSITTGSSAKVIDFGVAKAMTGGMTEQTVYTQIGEGIGTWGYMSPEQIEGDTQTPSDVYSLGVLLYELICGEKPYDICSMRNFSPKERTDFIRGVEILPPSKRLLDSIPQQKSRSISAVGQVKQLRELDWVCLKALSPDLKGRYLSVHTLAEDVQRFISGEQVEAAPMSVGFQIQRVWRRNSVAVMAFAIALFLLAVGGLLIERQIGNYQSLKREVLEGQNRNTDLEANLEESKREVEAAKIDLERTRVNLAKAHLKAAHGVCKSSLVDDTYFSEENSQAYVSIRTLGSKITSLGDGKRSSDSFQASISGKWFCVQDIGKNGDRYLLATHDGFEIQTVSELPIGDLYGLDHLAVTELDDGRVAIVAVGWKSWGESQYTALGFRVIFYDPVRGPIEPNSFFDVEVSMSERPGWRRDSVFRLRKGAGYFVPSHSNSSQAIIFDLNEMDLAALVAKGLKLRVVDRPKADDEQDAKGSYTGRDPVELLRSGGTLNLIKICRRSGKQELVFWEYPIEASSEQGGIESTSVIHAWGLPVETFGTVKDYYLSTSDQSLYVRATTADRDDIGYVLSLPSGENGFAPRAYPGGVEKWISRAKASVDEAVQSFFSYSDFRVSVDVNQHGILLESLAGSNFGISPCLYTDGGAEKLDALHDRVCSSKGFHVHGVTEHHVILSNLNYHLINNSKEQFVFLPREQRRDSRTWTDSLSSSSSVIKTRIVSDASGNYRQAVTFSGARPNGLERADILLPPQELIHDYFTVGDLQHVVTVDSQKSTLNIHKISKGELTAVRCFESDFPAAPLITFERSSGCAYVLMQTPSNASDEDLTYIQISISKYLAPNFERPVQTFEVNSDLLDFEPITSFIYLPHEDIFCVSNCCDVYFLSPDSPQLNPLNIRTDSVTPGWFDFDWKTKIVLVPGTDLFAVAWSPPADRESEWAKDQTHWGQLAGRQVAAGISHYPRYYLIDFTYFDAAYLTGDAQDDRARWRASKRLKPFDQFGFRSQIRQDGSEYASFFMASSESSGKQKFPLVYSELEFPFATELQEQSATPQPPEPESDPLQDPKE